ncbi:MAG TPA: enoyl-CoA hydratase-related protein [Terriglobales bacterium]|nr:enoyl-CoA hydratase-related protein [Terriglobales bacterium]
MELKTVLLAESDGVSTITLNRPEKRNAINFQLIDELMAALEAVRHAASQVLVLTGAGSAFCSGMDLESLKTLSAAGRSFEENLKDSESMALLFRSIYDFPKPTIAAVNGAAIAGGTGIATSCDFTLASKDAKFGYTEVRIGFIPAIVSSLLKRQVGEKHARDLLLTGRVFGAEEAYRMGLVNEVVEPEKLMPRTRELAAALMENSPTSIRLTKALLSEYARAQLDREMQLGQEENARIRATADFREGVTAFLEKRKAKWTGK